MTDRGKGEREDATRQNKAGGLEVGGGGELVRGGDREPHIVPICHNRLRLAGVANGFTFLLWFSPHLDTAKPPNHLNNLI